jgi:hypothetical protein
MMFKKIYIFIGFFFSLWNCCHLKIIQVDLYNINPHKVIFSQCGGLSLSIYLSRHAIYYGNYFDNIWDIVYKMDKPLYQNNTKMSNRYESNENKSISRFILLTNMLSFNRERLILIYCVIRVYFYRLDEIRGNWLRDVLVNICELSGSVYKTPWEEI